MVNKKEKQNDVLGLKDPKLIREVQGQGFMIGSDQALALASELDMVNVDCLPFADGSVYRVAEVLPKLREKVSGVRQQHKVLLRMVNDIDRNARSRTWQKVVESFRGNESMKKSPYDIVDEQYSLGQAALEEFKHMIIAHHGHIVGLLGYSVDLAARAQHIAITNPALESRCASERSLVQKLDGAVNEQKKNGHPHYLAENVTQQVDRRLFWHQGGVEENAHRLQQLTARSPLVEQLIRKSMHATRLSLRVYGDARDTVEHFYQITPTLLDSIYDGVAVQEVTKMLEPIRSSAGDLEEKAVEGYKLLRDFKAPLPEHKPSKGTAVKLMRYL